MSAVRNDIMSIIVLVSFLLQDWFGVRRESTFLLSILLDWLVDKPRRLGWVTMVLVRCIESIRMPNFQYGVFHVLTRVRSIVVVG